MKKVPDHAFMADNLAKHSIKDSYFKINVLQNRIHKVGLAYPICRRRWIRYRTERSVVHALHQQTIGC